MTQIIEGKPQLPPGFCFICELSNPVKYWDTLRDFEGIVREKLDGRKYVCEECLAQGAEALGFVTPKAYTALSDERKEIQNELNRVKQELETYKQIEELAAVVKAMAPKPSPARKPATAKA